MKRKIVLFLSLAVVLGCMLALAVNAECAPEHEGKWTLTIGKNGYLGETSAVYECTTCGETAEEKIPALFETLGYSYGESGIVQHYAANRTAIARYEELTGEKIRFGAVAATRNNVEANPLDENGNPVNEKVRAVDFTDTKYDIFDVMVNNIPEEYKGGTGIICCAYIMAGEQITYIENGAEKISATANTFDRVAQKVDTNEAEAPEVNEYKFIDGTKYRRLSLEDLAYTKYAYWFSTERNVFFNLQVGTSSTHLKYFATRMFEKEELPNGTIISTTGNWYYRPEGWVNGQQNGVSGNPARPGEVKTKTVVVDDAWWGTFTTRAFNVTTGNTIGSDVTAADIYDCFVIHVPVVKYAVDGKPPVTEEPETPGTDTPSGGTDTEKQNWNDDGALKILCIGNSFSVDSMEYVYQIARAAGVDNVVLGNLYIGGCSLATHLTNAKNDSGSYTYYKNTSGTWSSSGSQKISTAVKSEDWDFISVQQVSGSSGIADTYGDLDELLDIVEPLNPSARLVWHMTWAYKTGSSHTDFSKYDKDQMTMYNAIVKAVQSKILTEDRIEIVIPAGTAIQNARTSYYGDNFTRDGYHLNDFGRFIGSLTFVKALTGLSIDNLDYKLDSMTSNNLLLAIDAVNKAIAKPFEVTTSAYATEPEIEVPDAGEDGEFEGYRLLTLEEMGWQKCSYWNGSNFSYKEGDSFNQKYYGTKNTFTKDTIPVGSIIILKQGEGWQYRPDGWGGGGSRPDNVTEERVVVTESWWSGYKTRGFNLSKTNGEAINGYTAEQIYQVLKIYVPIGDEEVTSSVTDDMCVEQVTVIDGKEYRALTAEAMGLLKHQYYWSEKTTELYLNDQNTAKKFFATNKFDETILMNGAVIYVASGWQYRPEGWEDTKLNSTSSRPDNVSTTYVTVEDSWWGSFTVRAFNISKSSTPVLGDNVTVDTVYEVFKIYIPVEYIAD